MTKDFTTNGLLYPLTKGDLPGHVFRGNQYQSGYGGVEVSHKEFRKTFNQAFKNSPYSAFVNHYTAKEMKDGNMKALMTRDGKTGLLVHDHGDGRVEATALFSMSDRKGDGLKLLKDAIENHGVNYVECFGEFLPQAYAKVGFQVESKSPFDPQYAPDNWDYEKFGRPNYYTMRLGK